MQRKEGNSLNLLYLDMHAACVIEIEHKTSHAAQEAIDVWTSARLNNEGINPAVFGRMNQSVSLVH